MIGFLEYGKCGIRNLFLNRNESGMKNFESSKKVKKTINEHHCRLEKLACLAGINFYMKRREGRMEHISIIMPENVSF